MQKTACMDIRIKDIRKFTGNVVVLVRMKIALKQVFEWDVHLRILQLSG